MKKVALLMFILSSIVLTGCTQKIVTNSNQGLSTNLANKQRSTNQNWMIGMIPSSLKMTKVNNNELKFKYEADPNKINVWILNDTWNDGTPITMIESQSDIQKSDCFRGTTYTPGIAKNIVTDDENYFYCNRMLSYDINRSDKRFTIWKLVLKETDNPDIFDIVNYEFLEEDY